MCGMPCCPVHVVYTGAAGCCFVTKPSTAYQHSSYVIQELRCRSELVRRAERQGASDAQAQRDFAKADDMYLFGLLCAYMVFVPLSEPGSIDFPTLQRLVEVTFRKDFSGLRCATGTIFTIAVCMH